MEMRSGDQTFKKNRLSNPKMFNQKLFEGVVNPYIREIYRRTTEVLKCKQV